MTPLDHLRLWFDDLNDDLRRSTSRAVGDVASAAASNARASGEVHSTEAAVSRRRLPAQDTHLDDLEKALARTVAQASALIEQSKREVERSRDLLNKEPGLDNVAPPSPDQNAVSDSSSPGTVRATAERLL